MKTYLSYALVNGVPTATPANQIDASSSFAQTGNIFTCCYPGYNVMIFGAAAPGGRLVFQRIPIYSAGYDTPAGDFGMVEPQADGTVAIQWPV